MARFEAIKEKKHDGTLLITPFDILAKANGLTSCNTPSICTGITRDWSPPHGEPGPPKSKLVHAYIRGTIAGVDFLLDPANKDEAIAILRKHLPQMPEQKVAAQSYALMAGPKGFTPKAALNPGRGA